MVLEMRLWAVSCHSWLLAKTCMSVVGQETLLHMSSFSDQAAHSQKSPLGSHGHEVTFQSVASIVLTASSAELSVSQSQLKVLESEFGNHLSFQDE